jgi:hypothetical protein
MGKESASPADVRSIMNRSAIKADFIDENNVAKSIGGQYTSIEIGKDTIKEEINIDYEAVLIKEKEAVSNGVDEEGDLLPAD